MYEGALRRRVDAHCAVDYLALLLVNGYVVCAVFAHRHLHIALPGLAEGVGLSLYVQDIQFFACGYPIGAGCHLPGLAGGNVQTVRVLSARHEDLMLGKGKGGQPCFGSLALVEELVGLGYLVFGYAGALLGGLEHLDGLVVLLCGVVLHGLVVTHVKGLLRKCGCCRKQQDEQQEG